MLMVWSIKTYKPLLAHTVYNKFRLRVHFFQKLYVTICHFFNKVRVSHIYLEGWCCRPTYPWVTHHSTAPWLKNIDTIMRRCVCVQLGLLRNRKGEIVEVLVVHPLKEKQLFLGLAALFFIASDSASWGISLIKIGSVAAAGCGIKKDVVPFNPASLKTWLESPLCHIRPKLLTVWWRYLEFWPSAYVNNVHALII